MTCNHSIDVLRRSSGALLLISCLVIKQLYFHDVCHHLVPAYCTQRNRTCVIFAVYVMKCAQKEGFLREVGAVEVVLGIVRPTEFLRFPYETSVHPLQKSLVAHHKSRLHIVRV